MLGVVLIRTKRSFGGTSIYSSISATSQLDRKLKQDCSYQGEALNVPTAF